jgi:hypothetical protein
VAIFCVLVEENDIAANILEGKATVIIILTASATASEIELKQV